ncbi:Reversal of tor2 lethality [Emydomyces testavorans]|uniref:Protein ROT1 n=1 Tax=Emydomyces testavorans TaxID=2070801 RepID=A0AAF0IK58_9EURO|nr:Reversal of tor2 lethality [Emydomyces testavorans]
MLLLAGLSFFLFYFNAVLAAFDPLLVGTWSTKSQKVITGPGFYDPIKDRFQEPDNTGISYSFTTDGYFEEAYYRAISNR